MSDTKPFRVLLDACLEHLHDIHVKSTKRVEDLTEEDFLVTKRELYVVLADKQLSTGATENLLPFVVPQLEEDHYVKVYGDDDSISVWLTHRGMLFHEDGGYKRLEKERRASAIWTTAKTIANIANAVIVILIAAFALWLQFPSDADKSKDDKILQQAKGIEALQMEVAAAHLLPKIVIVRDTVFVTQGAKPSLNR